MKNYYALYQYTKPVNWEYLENYEITVHFILEGFNSISIFQCLGEFFCGYPDISVYFKYCNLKNTIKKLDEQYHYKIDKRTAPFPEKYIFSKS